MSRRPCSSTNTAAAAYLVGGLGTFLHAMTSAASHAEELVRLTISLLVSQIWPVYWASRPWWDDLQRLGFSL